MKTKILTVVLLVAVILGGCSNTETPSAVPAIPTLVPTPTSEVLSGVYMSSDPDNFPFPTSGYTVYIVGETHGNKEAKLIFQTFLQNLYEKANLRDVILEEDQAYETDANAYVHGSSDQLPAGLCLRTDILGQIREFNASHPADEQVSLHLVDVDSPLPIIYKHLHELQARIASTGDSVPIPGLDEFQTWDSESMSQLVDQFREVAKGQPEIIHELDTVAESIQWYFLGNRIDAGDPIVTGKTFFRSRENIISRNVQHLVTQLNGRPLLAFFGAAHGIKDTENFNVVEEGFKPWAERLAESGIRVYSLDIDGLGGKGYWREEAINYGGGNADAIHFQDGASPASLFNTHPDTEIIYTDLRFAEHANIPLPFFAPGPSAGQAYDGLILFKEFTPMENVCPQ